MAESESETFNRALKELYRDPKIRDALRRLLKNSNRQFSPEVLKALRGKNYFETRGKLFENLTQGGVFAKRLKSLRKKYQRRLGNVHAISGEKLRTATLRGSKNAQFLDGMIFAIKGGKLYPLAGKQDKVGASSSGLHKQLIRDLLRLKAHGITFENLTRAEQARFGVRGKTVKFGPKDIVLDFAQLKDFFTTTTTSDHKPVQSERALRRALKAKNVRAAMKKYNIKLSDAEVRAIRRGLTKGHHANSLSTAQLDTLTQLVSGLPPWRESRVSFSQFKNMAHFYRAPGSPKLTELELWRHMVRGERPNPHSGKWERVLPADDPALKELRRSWGAYRRWFKRKYNRYPSNKEALRTVKKMTGNNRFNERNGKFESRGGWGKLRRYGKGAVLGAMFADMIGKGLMEHAKLGNEKLRVLVRKKHDHVYLLVTLMLGDVPVPLEGHQQRAILKYWYKFSRNLFTPAGIPKWLREAR